jgi:protein-L-isoaspartate(D-aspartate) O-methyltransferase
LNIGISIFVGDGSRGIPEYAPFDKIIVTAYANEIYPVWVEELKEGGIIVLPLGGDFRQTLVRGRKQKGSLKIEKHGSVVFVPLIEDIL